MQFYGITLSVELLSSLSSLTKLQRLRLSSQHYGFYGPMAKDCCLIEKFDHPQDELVKTISSLTELKYLDLSHIAVSTDMVSNF